MTITLYVNKLLKPNSIISKNFELTFDESSNNKYLKAEFPVNCNENQSYYNNNSDNCIYLENSLYKINLELSLMRNQAFATEKYRNFEVELGLIGVRKTKKIPKIVFLEKFDFFVEFIFDWIYFPLRILGFYNYDILKVNFYDNYDPNNFNLEKFEILIKDKLINIKSGKYEMIPYIGWISYFIGLSRLFFLPFTFFITFFTQIFIYFGYEMIMKIIYFINYDDNNHTTEKEEKNEEDKNIFGKNNKNNNLNKTSNKIKENNRNIISNNTITPITTSNNSLNLSTNNNDNDNNNMNNQINNLNLTNDFNPNEEINSNRNIQNIEGEENIVNGNIGNSNTTNDNTNSDFSVNSN
jgi:hypothetical protein